MGKIDERRYLAINHCPKHDFYSICIEDEEGCGTRLTPSKCCGMTEPLRFTKTKTRFPTPVRWKLNKSLIDEIIDELSAVREYCDED